MDIISNINFINNKELLQENISKIPLSVKTDYMTSLRLIFNTIYDTNYNTNDIPNLISIFINAYTILQNKNNYLPEIVNKANNVIQNFNKLLSNCKYKKNIDDFCDSMEEFQSIYYKYFDKNYQNFKKFSLNLTKLLFLYKNEIYDNPEKDQIIILYNETTSLINNMYNIDPNNTIHILLVNMTLIHKCNYNEYSLEEYSWNILFDNYKVDKYNTLYIIIIELRKYLIDNLTTILGKKNLYYNIDIDILRKSIRDKNINEKLLNEILSVFQLSVISENKFKIEKSNYLNDMFSLFYEFYKLFKCVITQ
jgi:hypothetical protein